MRPKSLRRVGMSHRSTWILVVVAVSALCQVEGLGAADRVFLSLELPKGLPTGLRIPLQAMVKGPLTWERFGRTP
ncbi:MAG: hypothetical protein CM1200mP2_11230 [Planctomycetaceae bacterium]|nr:MAG: hypothetical protein CM1200mP2_11230 [Planctomycetaceae bacterium]